MRKLLTATAAALVLVLGATTAVLTAGAAQAATCALTWGSLAKTRTATTTAPLANVRAGRHTCYDRLVVDVSGEVDGYAVRYVDQVRMDGSGQVVPLRGGARLEIVVPAPASDAAGNPTVTPANRDELVNVTGWTTFRQVTWAGSFEGQTTMGLGVRARLPFRVLVLDGPGAGSRIVLDVAHRW